MCLVGCRKTLGYARLQTLWVDVRPPKAFAAGHIPGSYGIPLGTPLITWAGWVIPFGSPLIMVSNDAEEREAAVRQLIRIGYDDLRGFFMDGFEAWEADSRPVSRVPIMPEAISIAR